MPIKSNVIPTLVAWIGASCAPLWAEGPPVAFHGYLRAGIGSTSGRGEQVAFQLPGARSKYRLGNESDDYGEFQIDAPLYQEAPGGGRFAFHGMLAVSDVGNTFTAAQYWIEGTDLVGGPFEGARFWVGKRYYQRRDVYISDFFFWNNSGTGAGVEDIDVGIGKLHYAFVLTRVGRRTEYPDTTHEGDSVASHDLRLSGLKVNPGGELSLGVDLKDALPRKETISSDNRNGGGGIQPDA